MAEKPPSPNLGGGSRIYFPGFPELRGFAAIAVLLHHLELFKHQEGISSLYNLSFFTLFVQHLGENGVSLFFCLSGFLITYLLLAEKAQNNGKVAILAFYKRRILRIWPLYYVVVLIAFVAVPLAYQSLPFLHGNEHYGGLIESLPAKIPNALLLFVGFLPNLVLVFYGPIATAAQAWSVGVEEQFYLFWPWVLRIANKYLITAFFLIILLKIGSGFLLSHYNGIYSSALQFLWALSRFELMAIGAIAAYLVFTKVSWYVSFAGSDLTHYLTITCILVALFLGLPYLLLSLLFVLLISSLAVSGKVLIGGAVSHHLGTISYGLYMYHPLWLFISFNAAMCVFSTNSTGFQLMYYSIAVLGSLVTSHLSYQYLEKPFLRKKERFSKVQSGEDLLENAPPAA